MHIFFESEQELRYKTFSGILSTGKRGVSNGARSARNMYYSNPWDNGFGYIGPLPTESNPERAEVMAVLKRQFTPANKIKEVVDRVVDALLSRSPNWQVVSKKELLSKSVQQEKARLELHERLETANESVDTLLSTDPSLPINKKKKDKPKRKFSLDSSTNIDIRKTVEAEMILADIWNSTNFKSVLTKTVTEFLLTGIGQHRTYISRHYTRLANIPDKQERLLSASKYVGTEFIEPNLCKILDDDGDKLSIAKIKKTSGNKTIDAIEITFVEDGKTYIATFRSGSSGNIVTNESEDLPAIVAKVKQQSDEISSPLSLNSHILIEELSGDPFVTTEMIQQNRALNLDLTLGVSALVENGFETMVTTNADLDEVIGIDPETGAEIVVSKELKRGPNTAINLQGNTSVDEKGTRHFETPGVHFKEPTSIEVFDKAERLYYRQILAEARQEFVLMVGDSTTTGESRIQSRQDFLKKCQQYKNPLDNFASSVLTKILHLVANICGEPEYFKGFEILFDSRVSAGELSAAEQTVIVARYEKGLISRETALVLLGTEEPLIEIDKIRLDVAEAQDEQIRRLAAASKFSMMVQSQQSKEQSSGSQNKAPESTGTGRLPK